MITFVCGQLCSGKTVYSKALCQVADAICIEVGDIVRILKQTQDRKLLQDSKELFQHIVVYIQSQQKHNPGKDFVISGVRQIEILEQFPNSTLLWIECPTKIRKERYKNRNKTGDTQTFEEAEQGDIALGILEVKNYIFKNT